MPGKMQIPEAIFIHSRKIRLLFYSVELPMITAKRRWCAYFTPLQLNAILVQSRQQLPEVGHGSSKGPHRQIALALPIVCESYFRFLLFTGRVLFYWIKRTSPGDLGNFYASSSATARS
jgi:hypothetical protein